MSIKKTYSSGSNTLHITFKDVIVTIPEIANEYILKTDALTAVATNRLLPDGHDVVASFVSPLTQITYLLTVDNDVKRFRILPGFIDYTTIPDARVYSGIGYEVGSYSGSQIVSSLMNTIDDESLKRLSIYNITSANVDSVDLVSVSGFTVNDAPNKSSVLVRDEFYVKNYNSIRMVKVTFTTPIVQNGFYMVPIPSLGNKLRDMGNVSSNTMYIPILF